MGLKLKNSFKEVAREQQYGKLTVKHHVFRIFVLKSNTSGFGGLFTKRAENVIFWVGFGFGNIIFRCDSG